MRPQSRLLQGVATLLVALAPVSSRTQPDDGWIELRVRDSDRGSGVAATITVTSGDGAESTRVLPPSGRKRLALAAGPYSVEASAPGYAALRTRWLVTGGETLSMTLWLDPAVVPQECTATHVAARRIRGDAMLYGHVVDPDRGIPVAGATVELERSGAVVETGADGGFEIRVQAPVLDAADEPSLDDLVVRAPGYRTHRQRGAPLTDGDTHLIIDLRRGRGGDVDEHDGRPKVMRRGDPRIELPSGVPPAVMGARFEQAAALRPRVRPAGAEVTRAASSVWAPPATIRVGFDCVCSTCSTVQVFALETYVKRGLNDEWIASWSQHSLRAGAVPYRSYGVWYVFHPIDANYDICSTTCCQVNDADTSSNTDLAVDRTPGILLEAAGSILRAEYSAENNGWDDPGDGLPCSNVDLSCGDGFAGSPSAGWPCLLDSPGSGHGCFGHGRGMCQWGTQRWAIDQGRLWDWTVDHYYNDNDNPSGMRSGYLTSPLEIFDATPDDPGVEAGATFGIDLDVANLAALVHSQVLIGASLWSAATGYIDDAPNDRAISLAPGTGSVTRPFAVPPGTPEGSYDLLTALWLDVDEDGSISGLDLPMHTLNVGSALEVCSAPVAVGNTLTLVRLAPESVELRWSATVNATSYTVHRSTTAASGFNPAGMTADAAWIDSDASPALLFYEVASGNACGQSSF